MRKILLVLLLITGIGTQARAQKIGIKTNLLYDATTTMNLGAEIGLAPRWTLDISGNYNPWTLNAEENRKIKHYLIQPEARYWFCEKFHGHFIGWHAGYIAYNVSAIRIPFVPNSQHYRYEGWAAAAGISYGYSMILGGRWNLELTVGAGWIYSKYDKFDCATCGSKLESNVVKPFFGPTKAGISLIYMIK